MNLKKINKNLILSIVLVLLLLVTGYSLYRQFKGYKEEGVRGDISYTTAVESYFTHTCSGSNILITAYTGTKPNLRIPATMKCGTTTDAKVHIAGAVFKNNTTIKNVKVDSGVYFDTGVEVFRNAANLESVIIENLRGSLTSTKNMFRSSEMITELVINTSSANNTQNITDMDRMFYDTGHSGTGIPSLVLKFNTSNVTDFTAVFHGTRVDYLDIYTWNTKRSSMANYSIYGFGNTSIINTIRVGPNFKLYNRYTNANNPPTLDGNPGFAGCIGQDMWRKCSSSVQGKCTSDNLVAIADVCSNYKTGDNVEGTYTKTSIPSPYLHMPISKVTYSIKKTGWGSSFDYAEWNGHSGSGDLWTKTISGVKVNLDLSGKAINFDVPATSPAGGNKTVNMRSNPIVLHFKNRAFKLDANGNMVYKDVIIRIKEITFIGIDEAATVEEVIRFHGYFQMAAVTYRTNIVASIEIDGADASEKYVFDVADLDGRLPWTTLSTAEKVKFVGKSTSGTSGEFSYDDVVLHPATNLIIAKLKSNGDFDSYKAKEWIAGTAEDNRSDLNGFETTGYGESEWIWEAKSYTTTFFFASQPIIITINKVDADNNNSLLSNVNLSLLECSETGCGTIHSWVTDGTPKKFFVTPGHYQVQETPGTGTAGIKPKTFSIDITDETNIYVDGVKVSSADIVLSNSHKRAIIHHYSDGSTTRVHDDQTRVVNLDGTYVGAAVPTEDLYSAYANQYQWNGSPAVVSECNGNTCEADLIVTYYYIPNPSGLIVHHYEWDGINNMGTANVVCTDQITRDMRIGDHYTTSACRPPIEYKLYREPDNKEGTINSSTTTVTYYYIRVAKLTINHYEWDGVNGTATTRKLCNSIEENKEYGYQYTSSPCVSVPSGYQLVSTPTNATGTLSSPETVVNYYYNREGTVTVYHYTWDGFNNLETTDIVCPTQQTSYAFGATYSTSQCTPPSGYRFYKVEEDREKADEPSGIVSKFDTVVKYYYIPTGTLTVHHYEWDMTNNRGTTNRKADDQVTNNLDYGESYQTSAKNINGFSLYSTAGDPVGGKINKANTEVIYYYAPLANLVVHHYLTGGTTPLCDDINSTLNYHDNYNTEVCSQILDTYKFDRVTSTGQNSVINNQIVTGSIEDLTTTVTYYYSLKPANVIIHHYKWDVENNVGTTNQLCNDETLNGTYTGTYSTSKCTNLNDNSYKFMKVESTDPDTSIAGDTTNGTYNKDSIVITYYYDYKPARVITHHYITGTITKVAPDETVNTTYNVPYETTYKTSDKLNESYRDWYEYIDSHDGDNVSGTVNKDEMVVNYYYDRMKGTVTVHHYIKGTTTKLAEDDVYNLRYHDHYETSRKESSELNNPNYQFESVTGDDPEGNVNKPQIEVTYYYNAIPSKLIVHHYKVGTTEKICDDIVDNRIYNETYETHACANLPDTHHEFKSVVSNGNSTINGETVTGTFNQDEITITYYYGLKDARVVTHHYEVGTTNTVHDDVVENKKHLDPYTTTFLDSNNLDNNHRGWYYYINQTSGDQPNGVIEKDLIEVIYYYDKKPATLTVHHYIEGTDTKLHEDEVTEYKYHDPYETHYIDSSELSDTDYVFKNTSGDPPAGQINADNVDVIYYYSLKPANVIVHYYIEGTETKLCEDINSSKHYKDEYHSSACEDLNDHAYKFKEVVTDDSNSVINDSEVSGTVTKDTTTITYYYELKPANVIVHHYIEGTTTPLCEDVTINKLYKDQYEVSACTNLLDNDYMYKEVIVDDPNITKNGSNVTGTINQDTVNVIYYYELKPANLTVHHYIDGTTTKLCDDVNIVHKLKDDYDVNLCTNLSDPAYKFKNVVSTDINSTIEGSKVTGKVSNNFEVTYYYDLKSSQIKVHHLELDTNKKLAEDVMYSGLVYDEVTIKDVDIEGYRLVQKPENEKVQFTIEEQEFVYYYVKLRFDIEVEVIDGGGEITGEEPIYYGDDSTPDHIVITPFPEWEIGKILIDGEEIEVTNKDKMVIENFKDVKENHKIQVIFIERPIEVPITGSKAKLIIAGIIVSITLILGLVKFKFFKKKEI